MKIFSRIVTLISALFLAAGAIFNFMHAWWILGALCIAFIIMLGILSGKVGIWSRKKENW